jgi:hypothetical protein
MSGLTYSEEEAETAARGHVRFAGTNVDVVTYRVNDRDLCILMNKDGVCCYRATLIGAFDANLRPVMTPNPFLEDTFIVHDLASAREAMEKLERDGGLIERLQERGVTVSRHKPAK